MESEIGGTRVCRARRRDATLSRIKRPCHPAITRVSPAPSPCPILELRTLGGIDLQARDGREILGVLRQPKRSALLFYLVLARPPGFHRRDTLLALFWPESSQRKARRALSQSLYVLRKKLGSDVVASRGDEEVGIVRDALWCDATAFERLLIEERREEALELYRGELLPGFHVADVPGFERWLDAERERLRGMAANAAWALAEEREAVGDREAAARWGRRAAELCPHEERVLRRLLELLERVGDRAGALHAYEEFADTLAREFDDQPAAETRGLIERIRERGTASVPPLPSVTPPADPPPRIADAPAAGPTAPQVAPRVPMPVPARASFTRTRVGAAVAGTLAGLLLVAAVIARISRNEDKVPILAVGEIRAMNAADSAGPLSAIPDLLATSLARSDGVQVISTGRLYEIRSRLSGGGGAATLTAAAREAGVEELVEGTLYRLVDGLRLDLRRVDLGSGEVRGSYRLEAPNAFTLVDRATQQLLADWDLPPPRAGVASVTTTSLLAYRFYEEGLRAYYDGDDRAARRFFSAALGEDSAFAVAWYRRALTHEDGDPEAFRNDLGRAAALAGRASDRERLLIRAAWAQEMDDPRLLALADTLAVRYPTDPDGHLFLGRARMVTGDFPGAIPHLRRTVVLDSLSLHGENPRCRACDALRDMVVAYMLADSLAAAERVARRWTAAQPRSARAWRALASALEYAGRAPDALAARSRSVRLGSDNPRDAVYPAVLALRAGDFRAADRILEENALPDTSLVQQNVLWYRTLSLRYQGHWPEALRAARRYQDAVRGAAVHAQLRPWERVLEAEVLREMGHPRESAAIYREMAEFPYQPESASRTARHRTWTLTHAATGYAAAGDTAALGALADAVERYGRRSGYGRDRRLHHYVRGLLYAARGDTARAAGSFRRAVFSSTLGYARVNVELGRALLALGEPAQAADVLAAALRGPLDGNNLYANRTELHTLLARAHAAAGRQDSAAVHAAWVGRAREGR